MLFAQEDPPRRRPPPSSVAAPASAPHRAHQALREQQQKAPSLPLCTRRPACRPRGKRPSLPLLLPNSPARDLPAAAAGPSPRSGRPSAFATRTRDPLTASAPHAQTHQARCGAAPAPPRIAPRHASLLKNASALAQKIEGPKQHQRNFMKRKPKFCPTENGTKYEGRKKNRKRRARK
ncbi:hypothetical protein DFH09DRAFT_1319063 [Mycena vulgaris]|nr:hypothetical protein DFH09DRAFT_1319063 [Mycena vulgaris]